MVVQYLPGTRAGVSGSLVGRHGRANHYADECRRRMRRVEGTASWTGGTVRTGCTKGSRLGKVVQSRRLFLDSDWSEASKACSRSNIGDWTLCRSASWSGPGERADRRSLQRGASPHHASAPSSGLLPSRMGLCTNAACAVRGRFSQLWQMRREECALPDGGRQQSSQTRKSEVQEWSNISGNIRHEQSRHSGIHHPDLTSSLDPASRAWTHRAVAVEEMRRFPCVSCFSLTRKLGPRFRRLPGGNGERAGRRLA